MRGKDFRVIHSNLDEHKMYSTTGQQFSCIICYWWDTTALLGIAQPMALFGNAGFCDLLPCSHQVS